MSDLLKGGQGQEHTLQYLSQREYRPSNAIQPRSALFAAIGALICAIIAGAIVFVWHISGLPVIVGATGIAQGVILGLLLRRAFRRAKLRSLPLAVILSIACGLLSGTLTYEGLYIKRVYDFQREIRKLAAAKGEQSGAPALILNLSQRPFDFYDTFVLRPETGRAGLFGFLLSNRTTTLGGQPHRLGSFYIINTLLILWCAFKLGKSQVHRPFCEECGAWFGPPKNVAVLPASNYRQLVDAIQSGDPQAAIAVTREGVGQDLGAGCAIAQAHKCPQCGGAFVDVIVKLAGNTDRPVMRPSRVTPEMIQALKSEPALTVPEETPPSPPA